MSYMQSDQSNFSDGTNCFFDSHFFADGSSTYYVNHFCHYTNMECHHAADNCV